MHCVISYSDRPNNYSNFQVAVRVNDVLIHLQQLQCDLKTPVVPLGCKLYCSLLSTFIMEGNTKFHSEVGMSKDVLVFPPKFTDFCGAQTENSCLCLSRHHFLVDLVPHCPIGCMWLPMSKLSSTLQPRCYITCRLPTYTPSAFHCC